MARRWSRKARERLGLTALLLLLLAAAAQRLDVAELSWRGGVRPLLAAVLLLLAAAAAALALKRRRADAVFPSDGFRNCPERYHRLSLELRGTVARVLSDTLAETTKRLLRDKLRSLIGSTDYRGRYTHQRFLMTSNELRRGQYLLVEHNVKYGRLPLKLGVQVELRGEYLHTVGAGHFYGRLHGTHPPGGYLRVVP